MCAAMMGHERMLMLLLDHGCDASVVDGVSSGDLNESN
jgi:hypothetical protein